MDPGLRVVFLEVLVCALDDGVGRFVAVEVHHRERVLVLLGLRIEREIEAGPVASDERSPALNVGSAKLPVEEGLKRCGELVGTLARGAAYTGKTGARLLMLGAGCPRLAGAEREVESCEGWVSLRDTRNKTELSLLNIANHCDNFVSWPMPVG